jgi:hypothetical protein
VSCTARYVILASVQDEKDYVATPQETLLDLLERTKRSSVPVRRVLLQLPGPPKRPGPLSAFVSGRRALALDLYLMLHAGAASTPWDVRQPAMSWARMLELPQTAGAESTISRNWTWLERQKLARSERDHRIRKMYLLMEDGSGREFTRPTGGERGFLKLPYAYFHQRWHRELKLPGKATLLLCLAQAPTFTLPTEHASGWYGVSADTLQRGLDELRDLGLLKTWTRAKKAPRTRFGFTMVNHYALQGPFVRAPIEAPAKPFTESVT